MIESKAMKKYLGREVVHGGSTDVYVDRRNLAPIAKNMPNNHRLYIDVPTPEQLRRKLRGFVPPAMQGMRNLTEVYLQRDAERLAALS